jgi:exopolyphosphatase/guanosine-5'-triphosphate,3'-diphosphate pyrophosphatase
MKELHSGHKKAVFAAIDLGTNNCRLMLAEPCRNGKDFTIVESFSRITRLGEGMVSSHILSDKAMERTLKVMKKLSEKMKKYKIEKGRYVATEACRKAVNAKEFIDKATAVTGIPFEIISTQEEARLAILGCRPLVNPEAKYILVFDIGGGSSDISLAQSSENGTLSLIGSVSIPIGVLTVSEGFTGLDISGRAKDTIIDKVNRILSDFDAEFDVSGLIKKKELQVIGASGTVTSLGAFHLNLKRYSRHIVDGLVLSANQVRKTLAKLEGMSNLERITHPCIGPQRADLTLAGCAILEAILNFWNFENLTIADRGIREGILLDLVGKAYGKPNKKAENGKTK